jgi:hypothetical protein
VEAVIGIRDAGKVKKASGTRTVFILNQWEMACMPGFRMPHQFLSFGAGDGLYGGSVFVWVNYELPFELNAANVTGCFLVFARSAPALTVTLQLSLKGIPHPRTAPK